MSTRVCTTTCVSAACMLFLFCCFVSCHLEMQLLCMLTYGYWDTIPTWTTSFQCIICRTLGSSSTATIKQRGHKETWARFCVRQLLFVSHWNTDANRILYKVWYDKNGGEVSVLLVSFQIAAKSFAKEKHTHTQASRKVPRLWQWRHTWYLWQWAYTWSMERK